MWWAAELYRLKGELVFLRDSEDIMIDALFTESSRIVRKQGALALELRTAMSASRQRKVRGDRSEAQQLLRSV
jgi:hypothetical protein